jgi:predicted TIM-barrel fold metal-dependent hydrolase
VDGAEIDVHTHLASQTLADIFSGGELPAAQAEDLIARLDEGKVDQAVVLSAGYFGWPVGITDDFNMGPENDFVSTEVAKFPSRLIGFCGINPLFESAVAEVGRCLDLSGMVGVKVHMEGSGIDMTDDEHVALLSAVFDEAEAQDAPVMMHAADFSGFPLSTVGYRNLSEVLGAHPSLRVAHAHCAGRSDMDAIEVITRVTGPEYTSNAWVDVSACLKYFQDAPKSQRELIVWRLKKWGIANVLFGSDYLQFLPEQTPQEALETLTRYPFTRRQLNQIVNNDATEWLEGL